MDTQGSSISKPLAEVHINMTPKIRLCQHVETNEASQDSCRRNLYEEYRRIKSTECSKEVHIDVTPEIRLCQNTETNEAFQDSCRRNLYEEYQRIESTKGSKVQLEVEVNGNYRKLFDTAVKGDWKAAEKILDREAMTAKVMTIQKAGYDVLKVAVMAAQDQFVENLVKRLPLEYDAKHALTCAAQGGRIRMVKALVEKVGVAPEDALSDACSHAPMQKKVISYLARCTTSAPSSRTMRKLVKAGHLDICVYLAGQYPGIVKLENEQDRKLFSDLAMMKSYFRSGARLNFWEKSIYKCIPICLVDTSIDNSKDKMMTRAFMQFKISLWNIVTKPAPFIKRIGELKLKHKCALKFANLTLPGKETNVKSPKILQFTAEIILQAASLGIFEIVTLCLRNFPELILDKDFAKKLVKHVVDGRHVELFRLVNGHLREDVLTKQDLEWRVIDWSPIRESPDVSGAAFLLQRELQWFEVFKGKAAAPLKYLQTSRETFVQNRKGLLKEAGQWMKDTSSSCSLVAALIITVTFAAAFTLPGGNDGTTGIPIFLKKSSFMIFAVADSFALFSSVAATLMFLTILTSRYDIEDFRHSLPRNMILGLTYLFLSLAFMLVAFGSALTIVLSERLKWIYIPITLLAAFPVMMFAFLQLPLYVEMVESTFWPRLYHPLKLWE